MRALSAALAVGLLLASCAPTPTPYQPYRSHSAGGIHGGYSEEKLGPDEMRVRFHGNLITSRDRVEGYMLYRAAELTLQNGFGTKGETAGQAARIAPARRPEELLDTLGGSTRQRAR